MSDPDVVVAVDGPHKGQQKRVVVVPGESLGLVADGVETVYYPVKPYPSVDVKGRLKVTCDRGAEMSPAEVDRWLRWRARSAAWIEE